MPPQAHFNRLRKQRQRRQRRALERLAEQGGGSVKVPLAGSAGAEQQADVALAGGSLVKLVVDGKTVAQTSVAPGTSPEKAVSDLERKLQGAAISGVTRLIKRRAVKLVLGKQVLAALGIIGWILLGIAMLRAIATFWGDGDPVQGTPLEAPLNFLTEHASF